jgi:hypothetical protein
MTQIVGYQDSVLFKFVFCRKVNWSLALLKQNTSPSKNSFTKKMDFPSVEKQ